MEGNGCVNSKLSGLFGKHNTIDGASNNAQGYDWIRSIAYIKDGLMESSSCLFPGPLELRPGTTSVDSQI